MRRFILALLLAAWSTGALAASPQILALVQTSIPVAMTCAGESCRAELTAFCLQQERVAPRRGTAYDLAGAGRVRLVLRRGDGTVRRLGVEGLATFRSARSFAAVTVRVPSATLEREGALAAWIEVGPEVSLVPKGEDDMDAVARSTGALRAIGRRVVEQGPRFVALGATNALINALSAGGQEKRAGAIWARVVARPFAGADAQGLALARAAFDDCALTMSHASGEAVRVCLRLRHDAMIDSLTHEYWAEIHAGS